jgi:diadenosine tetraphosphate (Ap4A) HIT family hydrolase
VAQEHEPAWMPLERWDALVRGENCVLCRDLVTNVAANDFVYTVADLRLSRLWLATNQIVPGYCVLVCSQHVREPFDLGSEDGVAFFRDVTLAAQAIDRVFQPSKMNLHLMGNAIPHLHCHIIPRYHGDAAPGKPLFPDDLGKKSLDSADYLERVAAIKNALATLNGVATYDGP